MTVWYKSGLAWRAFTDLFVLLVVFYMPLAREWTHWNVAAQVSFFTTHLWILRTDLRAYGTFDHNGEFMMTRGSFLIYCWSIAAGIFIDTNALSFQVWQLSSAMEGDNDDISEQRIQLVVFGLKFILTGIRVIFFAVMYTDDPSKFNLHPSIVADVAHHASTHDQEDVKSNTEMRARKLKGKVYKQVPQTHEDNGETSTAGYLTRSHTHTTGANRAQLLKGI